MPNKNRLDVDGGESPLKQLREAVGLTQEELARRIGVSTKTISNWERGAYPATFNVPQIKALCRELRCSLEDLPDNFGPARSPDQG